MKSMLVACLALFAVAMGENLPCPEELETFDYQTQFCQANIVFNGKHRSGRSSLALTEDNREIAMSVTVFEVLDYIKDSTGNNNKTISIRRTYTVGDECDTSVFDVPSESYLVFAAGVTSFHVTTCGLGIAWHCVPQSAKDAFAANNCPS